MMPYSLWDGPSEDFLNSYLTTYAWKEIEITEYSEALVRKLIERIMVYDDRCDVEFKSGIVIEVYS